MNLTSKIKIKFNKALFVIQICLIIFLLNSSIANTQPKFVVYGSFKVEKGNYDGTNIKVTRDGQAFKSSAGKRSFNYELDYNHTYIFSFSKKGYVTKKIKIDTKVPDGILDEGFEDCAKL